MIIVVITYQIKHKPFKVHAHTIIRENCLNINIKFNDSQSSKTIKTCNTTPNVSRKWFKLIATPLPTKKCIICQTWAKAVESAVNQACSWLLVEWNYVTVKTSNEAWLIYLFLNLNYLREMCWNGLFDFCRGYIFEPFGLDTAARAIETENLYIQNSPGR